MDLQKKNNKLENLGYAALITMLLLISSIPVITGHLLSTEKLKFMGCLKDPWDQIGYLNFLQQVRDGHLLFTNLYTPESTEAILFNPFFIILGLIGVKACLPVVYQASRIVCGFAALWLILVLVRKSTDDIAERRFAFVMAATGGGFGWILWLISGLPLGAGLARLENLCPDFWYTEAYTMMSLMNYPHFMCALSLQISVYIMLLIYSASGNRWHLAGAGALTALLASVHPFDFITVYGVFATYVIILAAMKRTTIRKALLDGAVFVITSIAPMLYQAWFLFFHPVLTKVWVFNLETPDPLRLYLSYGLPAIFTTVYAVMFFRRRSWKSATSAELLLFSCLIFQCVVIYLPVPHTRRFIQGLQIPIGILGGIAMWRYAVAALEKRSRILAKVTALLLIIFAMASSFVPMGVTTGRLYLRRSQEFMTVDELSALKWLGDTRPSGVVLSSPFYGMWIPGLSGCRVYQGHWALTYDLVQKKKDYNQFIRDFNDGNIDAVQAFLQKWKIRCFFVLRSKIKEENAPLFNMKEEYRNPVIIIYSCE